MKGGYVAHVDATANDHASGHDPRQSLGNRGPTGAKMMHCQAGGAAVRSRIPPTWLRCPSKTSRPEVARGRKSEQFASLVHRDLGDDVRRRAEAIDPYLAPGPAIR